MSQKNKPLVSICCAAYNHEEYIEEALKGFLMQECDFEYEILIHDDASTDKTANIIKRYEKLHPDIIFPIYQTENQYSQGKKYSDLNYERVRGKYVAICEGDDCWTHRKKLSKQIEALKKNPKCGICFHLSTSLNCLTNKETIIGKYSEKDTIIDINDVIIKKYEMIPTASCIVTKDVLKKVLDYKSTRNYLTVGDLYFQIFGSLNAGAIYINEVMSLYRYFTPQSWSIEQSKSLSNQLKHLIAMAKSFQELDAMTNFKYSQSFQHSTIKRLFSVTGYETLLDIPQEFNLYSELFKLLLNELREEQYLIYGAGSTAKLIIKEIAHKINCVIDRDESKHGKNYMNKKLKALSKVNFSRNDKVIISLIGRSEEIKKDLKNKYGLKEEQIIVFDERLIKANLLKSLEFN